ncbi:MAG: phosphoribosylformimino-5-aminoimidazole carboxamide ribotide isomerase [Lachnospiraceae bacterium]|nr:phosphoribosylformimino-5-aminoimidazole carboxamide ribotide isomerase [Lachnospiraceae bacterium]
MFRPCIDIHNGRVKQIVGGSLRDAGDSAEENFVSEYGAADYAKLYKKDGLRGGHIILLNGKDSPYYEATKQEALSALAAYPGGLQIGGGITPANAKEFLNAGASHVIVTSYLFPNGELSMERLLKMKNAVGREHLVIDLSCKMVNGNYTIVSNRWQYVTKTKLNKTILNQLTDYCDEFLIHGVDVEGKKKGPARGLLRILSGYRKENTITYAGGIHTLSDVRLIEEISDRRLDYTVGSALSLFGGEIPYETLLKV